MRRITITGIIDLVNAGDESDVEAVLNDIRAWGTAEVTKVEELDVTTEFPKIERATNWHGD